MIRPIHTSRCTDTSSAKTQATRLTYLDVAKGIGIFLVVFAHINASYIPKTWIYSFHMPAFFIISGILFDPFKYQNFLAFLKRKAQALLCPYIFFSLLTTLSVMAADVLRCGPSGLVWGEYLQQLKAMVISQGSLFMVNSPLWFLTGLFVIQSVFYFIAKLYAVRQHRLPAILICIALSILGWFFTCGHCGALFQDLPWSLDPALFSIGFFALGYFLSEPIKRICSDAYISTGKHRRWTCFGILLACLIVHIPLAFWNGTISIGSRILNNGFLLYLSGIVGTAVLLAASILLARCKFLAYCGKQSLIIMCVHFLIRDAFTILLIRMGIPMYDGNLLSESLLPILLIFILSVLFAAVYSRIKDSILQIPHK